MYTLIDCCLTMKACFFVDCSVMVTGEESQGLIKDNCQSKEAELDFTTLSFFNFRPNQPMDYLGDVYYNAKNSVIIAERRILKELGFCVHVKHPHKIIITYLQILEHETNLELAQKAWNFMNDSLKTDVFVRFTPEAIACACIFLAARQLQILLPEHPPWWLLFEAHYEDIEEISCTILEQYKRPKRELSKLIAAVSEVKKRLDGNKTGVIVSSRDIEVSNGVKPDSSTNSRTASPQTASATASKSDTDKEGDCKQTNSQSRKSIKDVKSDESSPRVISEKSSGADSEGDNSSGNGSSASSPRASQRSSPPQNATDESPSNHRAKRSRRGERAASPIRRRYQHRRRSRSPSRSRDRRDHRRREDQRERNRDRDRDYGGDRRSGHGYDRDRGYRDRYGKSSQRVSDKYRTKSKYK